MLGNNIPLWIIKSFAPVRICDIGGWTDTWFAKHGRVCNLAVSPYVEVQVSVFKRIKDQRQIILNVENFGDRYVIESSEVWGKHPLLEASIAYMKLMDEYSIEISIYSSAPVAASIGTSAAVTVALIGALDLISPGRMSANDIAFAAHQVETELLGQQSGIQDQLSSAYGGINFIDMYSYPNASISQLQISDTLWWELDSRLVLIYLGKKHRSSEVHEIVIDTLEREGEKSSALEELRKRAIEARDALLQSDLEVYGKAMIMNNEDQRRLHPGLISEDADNVISVAKKYGALGWKVNGAGGDGGSVAILSGVDISQKRMMIREIEKVSSMYQNIPIRLSRQGVTRWRFPK
jgi:D-glycero-alpha-D-manno-heptose-7-phosphate kinase